MQIDHFREAGAGSFTPRRRTKLSVVLAVLGALAAAAAFGMSASAARAAGSSVTFASKPATVSPLNHFTQLPHGIKPSVAFVACQGMSDVTPTGPCPLSPPSDDGNVPGSADNAPHIAGNSVGGSTGSLGSNFDGISDVLQRTQTGFHFTPPDQALCVGSAGALEGAGVPLDVPPGTTVVVEQVNDAWAVYTRSGQRLWLDSNIDLFGDPYSSGDIECNFDQQTQTYYFTEIGALNGLYYGTNLVVMNHGGYSAYYVDTAEGGDCFPDFPHQGYDNNGFYITINEFCGADEEFAGANIYALSKQQLVFHSSSPNGFFWELPDSYYSFRAAAGDPTNTEYLLASEQNDFTQNALDFATVTGDNRIISGHSPYLSVTSIPSESFTEPVMALSTGDGTTCEQTLASPPPYTGTYCSVPESWLDPTDMRLEQVQYSHGQLYTSLDTALTVGDDPTVVDGAAWFQVDPRSASVVRQGYVGVAGTYLLMPSIYRTDTGLAKPGSSSPGTLMMGFSMTSPTLNPSSGYVVSKNQGGTFSPVTTTGPGSGPHISFSGTQPGYMRNRWGDYSRIAVDPVTGNAWMADEYIPPPPDGADTVDNWGTRVWEVKR